MLEFLKPVEHFNRKFDRAMTLFEFSALREPENSRFAMIGAYLRDRGIEFNEVPTPQMLWRGKLWPDLFISNQLNAVQKGMGPDYSELMFDPSRFPKYLWPDNISLFTCSHTTHGEQFHETFIEPLCRKITGRPSSEIAAKFHRSIWLPLYWPQTLRARKSIPTSFFYPRRGYAGAILEHPGNAQEGKHPALQPSREYEKTSLAVGYVIAKPRQPLSVAFVVDDSPIYRVTDQDVCAGIEAPLHRLIVEYRGECNIAQELERLGLTYHPMHMAFGEMKFTLPSVRNAQAGWRPRPHINDKLWSLINATPRP